MGEDVYPAVERRETGDGFVLRLDYGPGAGTAEVELRRGGAQPEGKSALAAVLEAHGVRIRD